MNEQPSTIDVQVATHPGTDVVTVRGDLDLATAHRLRAVVVDDAVCTQPELVVDLNEVTFLDSTGIATLVMARRFALGRGATLVLVCAVPHTLRLLRICRFDTLVDILDSPPTLTPACDNGAA